MLQNNNNSPKERISDKLFRFLQKEVITIGERRLHPLFSAIVFGLIVVVSLSISYIAGNQLLTSTLGVKSGGGQ